MYFRWIANLGRYKMARGVARACRYSVGKCFDSSGEDILSNIQSYDKLICTPKAARRQLLLKKYMNDGQNLVTTANYLYGLSQQLENTPWTKGVKQSLKKNGCNLEGYFTTLSQYWGFWIVPASRKRRQKDTSPLRNCLFGWELRIPRHCYLLICRALIQTIWCHLGTWIFVLLV